VTTPVVPLSRVSGVELARTGQWPASTGVSTLTRDDLASAIAALDCPAVRAPVIKLGHSDPRFDGEPAVGRITNLSVENDCSLTGDLVGMPGWLGPVLASAYPSRSIEAEWNHKCTIGHVHPFVLTGLALLGVTEPAIGSLSTLEDVADLWTREVPAEFKGGHMPKTIAASVTVEDIRRSYYDTANYDLWIEEVQLDPLQLIVVNDCDGTRSRIPVVVDSNADGAEAISFGQPVPVVVRYDDVQPAPVVEPADGTAPATPMAASRLRFASRADSRRDFTASDSNKKGIEMADANSASSGENGSGASNPGDLSDDQVAALRNVLGLTEDADADTFVAALLALTSKLQASDDSEDTADGGADEGAEAKPAAVAASAAADGKAPSVVTVDAEQFAALQDSAARFAKFEQERADQAADTLVDEAFKAGKIGRSSVAAYKSMARADFGRAKAVLDTLAASSAFPVGEVGHSADEVNETNSVRENAQFKNWKVG